MNINSKFLSKSKYINGLKCFKLLWYEYNRKEEIPDFDTTTKAIMEQGHLIGGFAQKLFPEGILIERDCIPEKHSEKSLEAIQLRRPLFEAGFIFNQLYALADILIPISDSRWDLIEVKSSTSVKDVHYDDISFQKYVYEGAGLKIRKCYIIYVNNQYIRQGDIEPEKLLTRKDVTALVNSFLPIIPLKASEMLEVAEEENFPNIQIGQHCNQPYACPMKNICENFLPKEGNILSLYYNKNLAYDLLSKDILRVSDIPDTNILNPKQKIQYNTYKTGQPYINKNRIREFLSTLKYPLYFLDFETINPGVPAYDNSQPYKAIPFQYSLHILKNKNSSPEHYSYLAPGDIDPRAEILKQLKELLGSFGSIVAYNSSFEKRAIQGATLAYPEYQEWFAEIEPRIVDLMVPFREFSYHHPDQEGSYSLKKILPILTGLNYKNMEISDGGIANVEYTRITFGKDVPEEEKKSIRTSLEKYCSLDTRGMIDILFELQKLCV
jgi:hypothetical protein